MVVLTQLDQISIAEICVYTPSLFIAIFLAVRHGFGRSAGWFYLVLFSLVRILGAALQLATLNDPTNTSLYVGSYTLQNIGLSPLILVMLGLTNRLVESVNQTQNVLLNPRNLRIVQLCVMVGLILGIVGGTKLGSQISNMETNPSAGSSYTIPEESKAGLGLMIAGFGILVLSTGILSRQVRDAEPGEKRLFLAIAAALPFVLVRLIFSAEGTFGTDPNFRAFGGSPSYTHYLVGMAVVMEMIAVAIFEGVGLTLQKRAKGPRNNIPLGNYNRTGTESV